MFGITVYLCVYLIPPEFTMGIDLGGSACLSTIAHIATGNYSSILQWAIDALSLGLAKERPQGPLDPGIQTGS